MMDVEKLIKQLRSAAKLEAYYNSEYNGLYNQTADALEKLQTELQTELQKSEHDNVNLTGELEKVAAELEQVKAERNGAIKDLNDFLSLDELCPIQCKWCKWEGTNCDGKTPEWRGPQKEG